MKTHAWLNSYVHTRVELTDCFIHIIFRQWVSKSWVLCVAHPMTLQMCVWLHCTSKVVRIEKWSNAWSHRHTTCTPHALWKESRLRKVISDWLMCSRITAGYGHMYTTVCIEKFVWLFNWGPLGLSDVTVGVNHHKDWSEYEHRPTLMWHIISLLLKLVYYAPVVNIKSGSVFLEFIVLCRSVD